MSGFLGRRKKIRGRDGKNGKLAKSYIDMICQYRPDFFLFENVKRLDKTQKHRDTLKN